MLQLCLAMPSLLVGLGAPCTCDVPIRMAETLELTPTLIEWGVDAELWKATRNKQVLLEMAAAGDEKKARERISFLKRAVEGGHTAARDRPYVLKGRAPAGVTIAAVDEMLARRVEMKKARDFDAADAIQAELLAMGVWVNDKQRTWEASKAGTGGYTLRNKVAKMG